MAFDFSRFRPSSFSKASRWGCAFVLLFFLVPMLLYVAQTRRVERQRAEWEARGLPLPPVTEEGRVFVAPGGEGSAADSATEGDASATDWVPDGGATPAETMTGRPGPVGGSAQPIFGIEGNLPISRVEASPDGVVLGGVITSGGAASENPAVPATPAPTPLPVSTISGRVTDEAGSGVANARVQLSERNASALTDAQGSYVMTVAHERTPTGATNRVGLLSASVTVDVTELEGFASPLPQSVGVFPGSRHRVNFVLEGAMPLDGYVRDAETMEPIEGAQVLVVVRASGTMLHTDAEGRFSFPHAPENGSVDSIEVSAQGYDAARRNNVSPLDGIQEFLLEPAPDVRLLVLWAEDDTPVTAYTYRIMVRGLNGLPWVAERPYPPVYSDQGRTMLEDLDPLTMSVEVTALDRGGQTTLVRGAADLDLSAKPSPEEVVVRLDKGQRVWGRVLHAEGRQPVEDARVEVIPPTRGRFAGPVDPIFAQLDPEITGADGVFAFEGLPPGIYGVKAERNGMQTDKPVDFEVRPGEAPPELEIILQPGAAIFGKVIGPDGQAMEGVTMTLMLQRPNADGWEAPQDRKTDAEGAYRFEGLPPGAHVVDVMEWGRGITFDREYVSIGVGVEKEVNFDFSQQITLTGRVTVNGKNPAETQIRGVIFNEVGSQIAQQAALQPDGRYEVKLNLPGRYLANPFGTERHQGDGTPFDVAEEPKIQTRNFDFQIVAADILVVFPEGEAFRPGNLVLAPRERSTKYSFQRFAMDQESRHIPSLNGGEYRVTYESRDRQWQGDSGWVHVQAGGENTFVIDATKVLDHVRIGGWESGQLSASDFQWLTFDVSGVVESAGLLTVLSDYEAGRHAAELGGARLTVNGSVVAENADPGWSGADQWGAQSRFALTDFAAGDRIEVAVRIKGDGGTDSKGNVYLSVAPLPAE